MKVSKTPIVDNRLSDNVNEYVFVCSFYIPMLQNENIIWCFLYVNIRAHFEISTSLLITSSHHSNVGTNGTFHETQSRIKRKKSTEAEKERRKNT